MKADVDRVLVVMAHPDDAEFWLSGTIAVWTDAGVEVSYCVLTDGDAGGFDPAIPRADIPQINLTEPITDSPLTLTAPCRTNTRTCYLGSLLRTVEMARRVRSQDTDRRSSMTAIPAWSGPSKASRSWRGRYQ